MKIAVASSNGKEVDYHFGNSPHFLIFELKNIKVNFLEIRNTGPEKLKNHDDMFNIRYELLKDCKIVICSKIGKEPFIKLKKIDINVLEYEGDLKSAIFKAAAFLK
ncbi:MAG: nitrogen fixation protein [Euryarchaeota archaeon]|nr:nitrogen fixation protein [Euryarchaeota archaeon]MBV1729689.1 nitrogen fixation protein [Methanobacterium sp.]MBU4548162.1 nitrogen fixation protein [Euryarchaeota archaeon]MBU4607522.1 nitrogen fixation protein [Euryarchaeota archaeon]MBV1754436.1 nitrogen fixation protein [Methanobacterium sp.]